MAVMLIAKFDGDVEQLRQAYDRAHALIMSSGGATGAGELRHHCAIGERALYIIGAWESEEHVRTRWASQEFEQRRFATPIFTDEADTFALHEL